MTKTKRQEVGKKGEDLAVKFLKKNKYKIIERNFQASKFGEIDIVAREKEQLVFVEVKTRTDERFGSAEEEFSYRKKRRFWRAVQNYLFKKHLIDCSWRADLIVVKIMGRKTNIQHYRYVSL
jgi:putative endonuclease